MFDTFGGVVSLALTAAKLVTENRFSPTCYSTGPIELKIELGTYRDHYYRYPGCFFDFVIFSSLLAVILIVFFRNRTKDFQKESKKPKNLNLVM